MWRSPGTVRIAATMDWARTCPPKTRPPGIHLLGPVTMSSRVRAPVSVRSRVASSPDRGSLMAVVYEQMSRTFTLADSGILDDLQVYLARSARIEEGSVRLIAGSGILAIYTAVLYPVGLLDETPTVLGLRIAALSGADEFDIVVPVRSLLQRVESAQARLASAPPAADTTAADDPTPVTITLPMEVHTVTWAAISPPRGGWRAVPPTDATRL